MKRADLIRHLPRKRISDFGMWISDFVFLYGRVDIVTRYTKHEIRNPHSEIRNSFTEGILTITTRVPAARGL